MKILMLIIQVTYNYIYKSIKSCKISSLKLMKRLKEQSVLLEEVSKRSVEEVTILN
jgi:hypothetical protein